MEQHLLALASLLVHSLVLECSEDPLSLSLREILSRREREYRSSSRSSLLLRIPLIQRVSVWDKGAMKRPVPLHSLPQHYFPLHI